MNRPTPYTDRIRAIAPPYDPWQIEAWMRCYFGTLDHLDGETFNSEVRLACRCVDADPAGTKRLVASYGWESAT